jgi:cytochrome c553
MGPHSSFLRGVVRLASLALCTAAVNSSVDAASLSASQVAQELRDALSVVPDGAHGAQLFQGICAACHGPRGAGLDVTWAPEIAGQHARVLIKELVDFRVGLRWYDPMERIAGKHVLQTPQEIADVAAYVAAMATMPESKVGNGQWVERGSTEYVERCQSCHGASGEGSNALMIPRVGGQQYEYLLWQMHDAVEGRRPNMKREHLRRLQSFVMEDFVGVADYMSRLRPREAGVPGAPSAAP